MEWILVLGLTMPIIRMLLQSEMKFEGSSDLGIAALQPTAAIVHSSSLLSDMIGTRLFRCSTIEVLPLGFGFPWPQRRWPAAMEARVLYLGAPRRSQRSPF
jgi:hypothetical protein